MHDFSHVPAVWNDEMKCSRDGARRELQQGTADQICVALLSVCQVLYLLSSSLLQPTQPLLDALSVRAGAQLSFCAGIHRMSHSHNMSVGGKKLQPLYQTRNNYFSYSCKRRRYVWAALSCQWRWIVFP